MSRTLILCALLALSACGASAPAVTSDVWLCSVPGVSVPVTVPSLDGVPVRLVALHATVESAGIRVDVGCARQVQAAAVAGPVTVAPIDEDAPGKLAPDLGGGNP